MLDKDLYIENDLDDNIDIMKYFKLIIENKVKLFIFAGIGFIVGIVVALSTPNKYVASTIMVPQMSGKNTSSSGLSGLAAMAGIDLSSMSQGSEMSPILYPQIVSSTPFQLELMNAPIKFDKYPKPISIYQYIVNDSIPSFLDNVKKYTIGLPGFIMSSIKGKKETVSYSNHDTGSLIQLTEKQYNVCKMMEDIVMLDVQPKEGYLTLSVTLTEPLAAAQLAQKAQELLQREITKFKIQKAKAELDFIQERYDEAQLKADGYQVNLAQKTDQYKNLTSAVPQVQTSRMQTKFGIASSVFQDLAKQLEQAKIQVKKDTPTFTVIQPVTIPNEKTGSGKAATIFMYLFVFTILGVVFIVLQSLINKKDMIK